MANVTLDLVTLFHGIRLICMTTFSYVLTERNSCRASLVHNEIKQNQIEPQTNTSSNFVQKNEKLNFIQKPLYVDIFECNEVKVFEHRKKMLPKWRIGLKNGFYAHQFMFRPLSFHFIHYRICFIIHSIPLNCERLFSIHIESSML